MAGQPKVRSGRSLELCNFSRSKHLFILSLPQLQRYAVLPYGEAALRRIHFSMRLGARKSPLLRRPMDQHLPAQPACSPCLFFQNRSLILSRQYRPLHDFLFPGTFPFPSRSLPTVAEGGRKSRYLLCVDKIRRRAGNGYKDKVQKLV